MKKRIAIFVLSVIAVAMTTPSQATAQVITRSGPNSAHVTRLMTVPLADQQLVTASITVGKSNRILMLQASVNDDQAGGSAALYWIYPIINGIFVADYQSPAPRFGILAMPPPASQFHGNANTMTWWVDLDSAGLANIPLNIELWGSASPFASRAHVSFSAFTVEK